MLSDKFQDYLINWAVGFYDEVDDLEKYTEEENLLMFKSVIGRCKDSLDELDKEFTEYIRIGIKGGS